MKLRLMLWNNHKAIIKYGMRMIFNDKRQRLQLFIIQTLILLIKVSLL